MSRTRLAVLLFAPLLLFSTCRQVSPDRPTSVEPLADSLLTVYRQLKEAVGASDSVSVMAHLDPLDARLLQALTRQNGYRSVQSYLRLQMRSWPDPDTLELSSLVISDDYARLTLEGSAGENPADRGRIHYTALLFRHSNSTWRLAAWSNLVKDQHDRFGYLVSLHETDLPPRLRFPRLF